MSIDVLGNLGALAGVGTIVALAFAIYTWLRSRLDKRVELVIGVLRWPIYLQAMSAHFGSLPPVDQYKEIARLQDVADKTADGLAEAISLAGHVIRSPEVTKPALDLIVALRRTARQPFREDDVGLEQFVALWTRIVEQARSFQELVHREADRYKMRNYVLHDP